MASIEDSAKAALGIDKDVNPVFGTKDGIDAESPDDTKAWVAKVNADTAGKLEASNDARYSIDIHEMSLLAAAQRTFIEAQSDYIHQKDLVSFAVAQHDYIEIVLGMLRRHSPDRLASVQELFLKTLALTLAEMGVL